MSKIVVVAAAALPNRARGLNRLKVILASLAVLALVVPAGAGAGKRAPVLTGEAAKLQVEPGNKVAFHAYAVGVQIYRWNGGNWSLVGPEALLFADADCTAVVGTHYVGPTWETLGGSKVVATVDKRCTVDPDSVDWLLLKAVSSEGAGVFNGVTFIQRVNTEGGKAPAEPGDFVGDEVEVPYATEYYFYRSQG